MARSARGAGTILAAVLAGAAAFAAPAAAEQVDTFEVTITNLTSGQPLTPPVVATHRGSVHVFGVGGAANFGVKEIAENGNNGPLLTDLGGTAGVSAAAQAGGGPLVPAGTPGSASFDDSVTFEIAAGPGANFLSFVSMLICTNDGFTGVDRARLPNRVGETAAYASVGYDAGTEVNTEDLADIVPPCQGVIGVSSGEPGTGTSDPALAEGGTIHHHAGVAGGADLLPAVHGWDTSAPVAEISITRVS